MDLLRSILSSNVALVAYGVVAAIAAGAALMWSKHPARWIVLLLTIGWVYLLATFDLDGLRLDPQLPGEFYWRLRLWMLVLGLIVLYTVPHLFGALYWDRRGGDAPADAAARFPDLEAAWDEVLARLSQARFDAAGQNLFLLLSEDESLAAELVRASGMNLFAAAPTAADAPIHAHASADGLFLSCAGASAWGRQDDDGTARLESLCRKIEALNPDRPTLRGIAVLFPRERAAAPDALRRIGPLRNDLQTIQNELKVRCPVIAVFCSREPGSAFDEFAARMPAALRNSRCGFSTPATQNFDHGVAERGFRWYAQWLQSWSLNLMVQDYQAVEGNSKLVRLNAEVRRDLPALCTLVETAFSTHARSQPILVRGCYFASVGPAPENHAFVAGLARGPRSKMLGDAPLASWAGAADVFDRRCKRAALAVGLSTAAVASLIWILGVVPRFAIPTPRTPRGAAWIGWAGLGLLAAGWSAALLYPRIRGRRRTAEAN